MIRETLLVWAGRVILVVLAQRRAYIQRKEEKDRSCCHSDTEQEEDAWARKSLGDLFD